MRRFQLVRDEDVSGVSGTGVVAEGVAFSGDGPVALRWLSEWPTSVVFHDRGVESLEAVHVHQGRTRIVWIDGPSSAGVNWLPAEELRSAGYLAAVNQEFFHPLGLALAVDGDRVGVIDDREDLEGWVFDPLDVDLVAKVENVHRLRRERLHTRLGALGFWIQPITRQLLPGQGIDPGPAE